MARTTSCALVAAVSGALIATAGSAEEWDASLTLTSDYIVRGITRSDGDPSIQADLHLNGGSGWTAGLAAATARLGPYDPISAELAPYIGYGRRLGDDWQGRVSATHYDYPGSDSSDQYRYDELAAGVGWRNRLFFNAALLPDTSIESKNGKASGRLAYAVDLAGHAPLLSAWSFNAGFGYYDLHDLIGVGYLYWNAGLAYDFGSAQFDLSWIGTNATAKSLYYEERAGNRWAATLNWHLF